ncbi:hypothetical protein HHK36_016257 [Tetracentron sinense]|uniref:RRM domain-containing protein n=1 Tax=Tetracentron sinense TaxID=13715 RepID=A0A834YWW0_TETSI|nr:hypothetical protein HHK36_016257 [Tetracentron sinense]
MMSYSRRLRYSRSPSPYRRFSRSVSKSLSRSRSRSRSRDSTDVDNPGNNLYVTGLSPRITKKELEKHFSSEGGTVVDIHLVVDPWTRESRGFGFVTMSTVKEAERCLKYLNHSALEGRVITVEKVNHSHFPFCVGDLPATLLTIEAVTALVIHLNGIGIDPIHPTTVGAGLSHDLVLPAAGHR